MTWCIREKLLSTVKDCPACSQEMRMAKRKRPEGVGWRCPRKVCRKEVSIRKDTFFSGSHLKMEVIIWLILLWATKTTVGKAVK